jgi:diguanylate cyclase (GGDEF)-like protein
VAILFVLPLAFLLSMLARDRSRRIDQAHRRLKLVERERARLQSAVRRLGDAFAAKLELRSVLEILLHGAVEALDAGAGRLELAYAAAPVDLSTGATTLLHTVERDPAADGGDAPLQMAHGGGWQLSVPMRVASSPRDIAGELSLVRAGRAFEHVEIALISELVAKVELAAGEIITHYAIREEATTDPLTGLGNRRRLTADLAATFDSAATTRPSLLLLFDLDGFKNYNDTFGHVAGDALLGRLGGELKRAVEGYGRAYRLGGDEFCAHLELQGLDTDALIRRAAGALSETGAGFAIQASLGVVLLPHEADSAEHALQIADQRMYGNKRGRSTAVRSQTGEVLRRTMHAKQPDLDEHSSQVAELAARVARRMGLRGEAVDEVSVAAQLHDIGKVGIPDAILNKASPLSESEWKFIRNHTILGERILHGAPALRPVARLVRASHERWDGAGYPDRLRSDEIPLGARIVSVCDAYEAMTGERPYRTALSTQTARQELRRCSGRQFDPAVVDAFLSVVESNADDREPDAAQDAAVYVQTLLGIGSGASNRA